MKYHEPLSTPPPEMQHDPYRLLAAMVVQRAISDIATAVPERGYAHVMTVQAEDARDFLQRRLWEPGNWWGEQLADLLGQHEVKIEIQKYCLQAQVRPMQRRNARGQKIAMRVREVWCAPATPVGSVDSVLAAG